MSDEKAMGKVIQIDEARIRDHLGEMVRGTVEETLNAMLEAEADQLCGAGRYERSEARQDTRAGSYERSLQTQAGEVSLKVPKQTNQRMAAVPAGARIGESFDCHFGQAERVVEFAVCQQSGIGRDHGAAKLQHQAPVE